MGKDKVGDKSGGKGPRLSRQGAARRAARLERSAGALRDNLGKRKAQARARAEDDSRARAEDDSRARAENDSRALADDKRGGPAGD